MPDGRTQISTYLVGANVITGRAEARVDYCEVSNGSNPRRSHVVVSLRSSRASPFSSEAIQWKERIRPSAYPELAMNQSAMTSPTINLRCWTKPSSKAIAPPASGRSLQVGWLYEHAVDFDELKRFHYNLGYGLLGRLIERSPLPFGRHRWGLRSPAVGNRHRPRLLATVLSSSTGSTNAPRYPSIRNGDRAGV